MKEAWPLLELTRGPEEINGSPAPLALNPLTIVAMSPLKDATLVHVVNGPAHVVRENYLVARNAWQLALRAFVHIYGQE